MMAAMNLRHLSRNLTSYDLLKSLAVVLMVVDHAGYYFYPEEAWFRVLGRVCVPIWFFLIGYANSRDIGPRLWIGAAVLIVASAVMGMGIFPLNILVTMIVLRLCLDHVMAAARKTPQALWQAAALFSLLGLISAYAFEYGTLAIVMAMFGWLVRHGDAYPDRGRQAPMFMVFSAMIFIVLQSLSFPCDYVQMVVMALLIIMVMSGLFFFKPVVFEGTGTVILSPLRLLGRYTLEIYVVHLLLFKLIAVSSQPERFHWFDWRWAPQAMLSVTG